MNLTTKIIFEILSEVIMFNSALEFSRSFNMNQSTPNYC